jgi:ribose-phosphate pyrophosphokinase
MNNLDGIVVFSLTRSKILAKQICDYLEIEEGKIDVKHFADGEILVQPQQSVRGKRVFIVQSTCTPVTDSIMEILICIDACKRASASEINIITPYYGYARQDRKAKPRQPITAKLIADLLQVAGANRVVTIDLHATQVQGFFNIPTDDLTAMPMLGEYFREKKLDDIVIVSPDHGGTTRARGLANELNAPLAIIDKRRPQPNVAIAANVIGDVNGKNVIVVDDICDTAGSLVAACNLLKEKGAKDIYCAITHGIFSGPALERIENSPIKEIVITNTIELPEKVLEDNKKITVLSIGCLLAKLIEAITNNSPVSYVYDIFK